jgi:hypothetical protein
MLRGSPIRGGALASLALAVTTACTSSFGGADGAGSSPLPRGHPAVVSLENARFRPPRVIALVSSDHPGVARDDAALRRAGFKKCDSQAMDALLDRLDAQGFLQGAMPVPRLAPLDASLQLSRLTVTVDDRVLQYLVPRHPPADIAARFNAMAHSVSELFNAVVDLRASRSDEGGEQFLELQQRLLEANAEKLRNAAKPEAAK